VDEWTKAGGAAESVDKIAESNFGRAKDARRVSTKNGANQTNNKRKE